MTLPAAPPRSSECSGPEEEASRLAYLRSVRNSVIGSRTRKSRIVSEGRIPESVLRPRYFSMFTIARGIVLILKLVAMLDVQIRGIALCASNSQRGTGSTRSRCYHPGLNRTW